MVYKIDYIENMMRMYAKTAEDICRNRWDWVAQCKAKSVLDYGSGCGFFRAWRPKGIEMDSYDVVPNALQTGIRRQEYDLITLFDVLEHMDGFSEVKDLLSQARFVAVTVPIKPKKVPLKSWVHWKPMEHVVTFDKELLVTIFESMGFELIKFGQPECPPRVDIWSFLFERL